MHGRMAMAASESLHAISAHHVRDEYPHLMRAVLRPKSVLRRELDRTRSDPSGTRALSLSLSTWCPTLLYDLHRACVHAAMTGTAT